MSTNYKFFRAGDKLTSDCRSTTRNSDYIQKHPYISCEKKNNSIYLYPNGGKGEFAITWMCASGKCTLRDAGVNYFTKQGYTLTGWSTSTNQTNCIDPALVVSYADYDKLYACWQREVVVVPDPITSSTTTTTTRTMPVTHPAITLPNNNNNNNNNNNSNNSSETPVPESPKTGVEDYILGLFLSLVVLGIAFVLINNKKQFFKKI